MAISLGIRWTNERPAHCLTEKFLTQSTQKHGNVFHLQMCADTFLLVFWALVGECEMLACVRHIICHSKRLTWCLGKQEIYMQIEMPNQLRTMFAKRNTHTQNSIDITRRSVRMQLSSISVYIFEIYSSTSLRANDKLICNTFINK